MLFLLQQCQKNKLQRRQFVPIRPGHVDARIRCIAPIEIDVADQHQCDRHAFALGKLGCLRCPLGRSGINWSRRMRATYWCDARCWDGAERRHVVGLSVIISILITFLVVILVLYLVQRIPIEDRIRQIIQIIVILIGIVSLLKYLAVF